VNLNVLQTRGHISGEEPGGAEEPMEPALIRGAE